eukprot:1009019-Alexandrium_andersonii.AAC.1
MSASLVGSEMCIRDSTPRVRRAGDRCRQQSESEKDKRARPAIPAPVSYTHLTLPTICSV